MVIKFSILNVLLSLLFAGLPTQALALSDQWYLGIGAGASWLQPNAKAADVDVDEPVGQAGTFFLGRDLDDRSSGQLQLYALGEAQLEGAIPPGDADTVPYYSADASVLYRFFDSRDYKLRSTGFGAALYGRFALGFLFRDSDLSLRNDAAVYFGAGGGVELFISDNVSLRAEGMYHESDAASATLSLVTRFGGSTRGRRTRQSIQPSASTAEQQASSLPALDDSAVDDGVDDSAGINRPGATIAAPSVAVPPVAVPPIPALPIPTPSDYAPSEAPPSDAAPSEATPPVADPSVTDMPQADLPVTPDLSGQIPAEQIPASTSGDDEDGDGVNNAVDVCPNSSQGYPVRENGCALYDGILRGVRFIEGTDELQSTAYLQLDYLASSLKQFPQAKVELRAHTDTLGTSKEQSILTRARLKAVGTYLVRQGVTANRLVLRSFGGTRPLYNSREVEGRRGNNRIEVIESSK